MKSVHLVRRSLAALIDISFSSALFGLIFYWFGHPVARGNATIFVVTGVPTFFVPIIWIFYYPYTESCFGKTLGKFIFGLTVHSTVGDHLSFKQAFLRRVLDPLEIWFGLGIVGLIVASLNPDGKRLGDKLGDTIVRRDVVA